MTKEKISKKFVCVLLQNKNGDLTPLELLAGSELYSNDWVHSAARVAKRLEIPVNTARLTLTKLKERNFVTEKSEGSYQRVYPMVPEMRAMFNPDKSDKITTWTYYFPYADAGIKVNEAMVIMRVLSNLDRDGKQKQNFQNWFHTLSASLNLSEGTLRTHLKFWLSRMVLVGQLREGERGNGTRIDCEIDMSKLAEYFNLCDRYEFCGVEPPRADLNKIATSPELEAFSEELDKAERTPKAKVYEPSNPINDLIARDFDDPKTEEEYLQEEYDRAAKEQS
jgi:hypothetical protein